MATRKKAETTRTKAVVGKERRLALALKAVIDAWAGVTAPDANREGIEEAETAANELLNELGYSQLESIPSAIKRLTAELTAATEASDWKRVSEIGQQLDRVKLGLPAVKVKEAAA